VLRLSRLGCDLPDGLPALRVFLSCGGQISAPLRAQLPLGYAHIADVDGRIADAYRVDDWRTILFLDDDHLLRSRIVGEPTEPEFMRGLCMATG
jgi:hypothetical protein